MIQNRENGKSNNNKNKKLENINTKMEKQTNDFKIILAEQSKSELLLNSFFEGFAGVKVNLPSPWRRQKGAGGAFAKAPPAPLFVIPPHRGDILAISVLFFCFCERALSCKIVYCPPVLLAGCIPWR